MPNVTRTRHHVTVEHIRYLAAKTNTQLLADTTDGIALVGAGQVFAPGSKVTRVLLIKEDLRDTAGALNLTMTEYLDKCAATIAAELNQIREGD